MFSQGRSFQPATNASIGQAQLRIPVQGGVFNQQAFIGQGTKPPEGPRLPDMSVPVAPDSVPPKGQEVRRHPAMRIAWGRLKKMDAKQLADTLAKVLERMKAKGIPPGMVEQIQARLASFATTAPETETVEITEPEVIQMEAELLDLEAAEAKDVSGNAMNPWVVGLGAALGLGILASWLSD